MWNSIKRNKIIEFDMNESNKYFLLDLAWNIAMSMFEFD